MCSIDRLGRRAASPAWGSGAWEASSVHSCDLAKSGGGRMHKVGAPRWFSIKRLSWIGLISVVYLLAAASIASRRAPWNDEGWFAEPAYTLITKGYMGSPIIHPRGTWLRGELTGIQTHTYWIMPGSPLIQAAWYRLFGFGVMQMRAISILAGLLVIWTWAFLVWNITGNLPAA